MTKLWLLLIPSLLLAYLIQNREYGLRAEKGSTANEHLLTAVLIILLSVFCGLRVWYNDTVTYLQMFDQAPVISEFQSWGELSIATGVGFKFIVSLIKTLGLSSQDYLMIFAFLTVTPYVLFVRKYCRGNLVLGVFLMFATGFYTFSFAAIKQCVAIAICLLAVPRALDRKWISFVGIVLAACLFHPYAVVYLLTPLLMFRPWTIKTYLMIGATIALGVSLQPLLGVVVDVTTMIGASYSVEELSGEGVNFFRVLVAFVPLALSFILQRGLFWKSTRTENLMMNYAMMNALIMFIGLFGTANYFARLANYFLPAQVVVLPWILGRLQRNDKKTMKFLCVLGYLGYFYYENGILKTFDTAFSQTALWPYIASHF